MPIYRVTIRYGAPRPQYAVLDVEGATLAEALRRTADQLPPDAAASADLAEIRLQLEPEQREYTAG
jgi:hypothetical protein